jgi:hypothetical protein
MNNNTWKVTIGKFEDWEALENRKNIKTNEESTIYSCDYDLFYKGILIASYGKKTPILDELELIKNQQMSDNVFEYFINELSKKLDENNQLQFAYNDKFFDLFASAECGYSYNVYPNEPFLIFDDNGKLIDVMQQKSGLCNGESKEILLSIIKKAIK